MENLLEIKNLTAMAGKKQILNRINLEVKRGEIHVVMGPNGAGKSTLMNVIFNSPAYKKAEGTITFDGEDITNKKTDEIARLGLFLSFQTPVEIEGLSVFDFIKSAKSKIDGKNASYFQLKNQLEGYAENLNMKPDLLYRDLNTGFSGGEKKKAEMLQLLALNPKLAILDETDSGLDVDAVKIVSQGIKSFHNQDNSVIIITHNAKILEQLNVDFVHILIDGKIVKTGDSTLIDEVEKYGFDKFKGAIKWALKL